MADNWKKKYREAFGDHLKDLRNEKKLTQLQLSKRSGLSLGHISRMERGARRPSVTTLMDLAYDLKLEPSNVIEV